MVGVSDGGKVIVLNGSSGTGETHAGVYAEEAHRPPRGKRASLAAINYAVLLSK
jgi:hypothetical protein